MLVPWRTLNEKYKGTATCRSGAERKRQPLVETELQERTEMAFEAYGTQLEAVTSFKYLRRILTTGDND